MSISTGQDGFSDEMLMRFADGELDADEMAVIEQAMATNDNLVARVAMFIETKAEAQSALKPLLDEPVPEKLKATVEAMIEAKRAQEKHAEDKPVATVMPFEVRKAAAKPTVRQWTLPLAASLAAVIGGLAGYWSANTGDRGQGGLWVAGVIRPALGEALATVEFWQGNQARRDQRPVPGHRHFPSATVRRMCAANSRSIRRTVPRWCRSPAVPGTNGASALRSWRRETLRDMRRRRRRKRSTHIWRQLRLASPCRPKMRRRRSPKSAAETNRPTPGPME